MGMGPPADQRGPRHIVTGVVMCRRRDLHPLGHIPPILRIQRIPVVLKMPCDEHAPPVEGTGHKHPGLIRLGQNLQRGDLGRQQVDDGNLQRPDVLTLSLINI